YPGTEPGNDKPPIPQAEPIPDWSQASKAAITTKDIHVYGFATLFLIVSVFCVIRLWKLCAIRRHKTVSAVQFKTFLVASTLSFSVLRSIVLYSVGYGSRDNIPLLFGNMLWGIAFSCLAAAFSFLLVILMETTQFRSTLPCSTIQGHILTVSTIIYVIILITTDVILLYTTSIQVTLIVCRLFFVTWGATMMTGYFTVSYRINRNVSLVSTAESRSSQSPLKKLSALLSFCAMSGLILMAIQIYATFDVIFDLTAVESPAPWPWLALQTSLRVLEVLMCGLLMLISRGAEKQQRRHEQFDYQTAMDTRISASASELRINMINTTQSQNV
ncbi:uncharacterized protein, partial [Amphiura filiformis]|uniref:uncharacterized protein n=1 Tax=Amphiura filiformis TaxID=82378 RepID=UPI003B211B08